MALQVELGVHDYTPKYPPKRLVVVVSSNCCVTIIVRCIGGVLILRPVP